MTTVVYVTNEIPLRGENGGQVRERELISRVAAEWSVVLVVVSTDPFADRRCAEDWRRSGAIVDYCIIDADPDQAPSDWSSRERAHFSSRLDGEVRRLTETHGASLVHVEGYFLSLGITLRSVPLVLLEENIEFQVGHSHSQASAARREIAEWHSAAAVGCVSVEDQKVMGSFGTAAHLVLSAGDHLRVDGGRNLASARYRGADPTCPPNAGDAGPIFYFPTGGSWWPTAEALDTLLSTVWPAVALSCPRARLHLCGLTTAARRLPAGVEHAGFVADLEQFISSADALLAPIMSGGGSKIKCAEALQMGKPVFTTDEGFRGLPPKALAACIIDPNPAGLAHRVVEVLHNPQQWCQLVEAARDAHHHLPRWDDSAAALTRLWRSVL